MTELTDNAVRVFEILRAKGPLSVAGIAKANDPEAKPDPAMVSAITYALKGLEDAGLVVLDKSRRPFVARVDNDGLASYVESSILQTADLFFRGELDALVHFIDTNLSGGRRARAKPTGITR
jgi:hypothetical protein